MIAVQEKHTQVGELLPGDVFYLGTDNALYCVIDSHEVTDITLCYVLARYVDNRYVFLVKGSRNDVCNISDNTPCVHLTLTEQPS